MENEKPGILEENGDFAVLWKPPRMHCAPLNRPGPRAGASLLDWYAAIFPPVLDLAGRKPGEGGLVHRLDFETQGLVLAAKNQRALDFFLARQDEGAFDKEYSALCRKADTCRRLPGFPPPPEKFFLPGGEIPPAPWTIETYFRPFGPGRKQVRPVSGENRKYREIARDRGEYYRTRIINFSKTEAYYAFTLRIRRGFRHQIRCHLAWLGFPVVNDPLYGTPEEPETRPGFLCLCSQALFFADPRTGEPREKRVPPPGLG